MQTTEGQQPIVLQSSSSILDTSSITLSSVTFMIDGAIKTPKVITVPRGATQEAICVETFDADSLPVTRCEMLATIGMPPELPGEYQKHFEFLAGMIVAFFVLQVLVSYIFRGKS